MSTGFLVVAVLAVFWGVVDTILIAVALDKRGVRVNPFLWRIYVFRYLRQYRTITLNETGKVGPLYHSYVTSMTVALVCAVIGLILRARSQ